MAIRTHTVIYGQSLQDVAMQRLGAADGVWHLADLNGLASITELPPPGTVLKYDSDRAPAPIYPRSYEASGHQVISSLYPPPVVAECTSNGFGCGRFETTLAF